MNYNHLVMYRLSNTIMIPPHGTGQKFISMSYFPENTNFASFVRNSQINVTPIKTVFVPTTNGAIKTYLDNERRAEIVKLGMKPVKGFFENVNELVGRNFFVDLGLYVNTFFKKYPHIKKFNTSRVIDVINGYVNNVGNIDSKIHERTLLYHVDAKNGLTNDLLERRFFPIYYKMLDVSKGRTEPPFDKLLLYVETANKGNGYILLYSKGQKFSFSKFRTILLGLSSSLDLNSLGNDSAFIANQVDSVQNQYMSNIEHLMNYYNNVVSPPTTKSMMLQEPEEQKEEIELEENFINYK